MPDPNRPRYTLEHGSYYLRNPRNGNIEKMVDQVTISYSCMPDDCEPDSVIWTIHAHGALDDVRRWWKKNHEAARPLFGEVNLITLPRKFDPERINTFIELPATLETLLAEVDDEPPRLLSTWDWIDA